MPFFGTKKKTKKHDWRAIGAGIFYSFPTTDLILWVGSGGGGDRDNWEWRRRGVSSSIWRVPKITLWARWTWSTCTGESRRGFYPHSTSFWLINSCLNLVAIFDQHTGLAWRRERRTSRITVSLKEHKFRSANLHEREKDWKKEEWKRSGQLLRFVWVKKCKNAMRWMQSKMVLFQRMPGAALEERWTQTGMSSITSVCCRRSFEWPVGEYFDAFKVFYYIN